MNHADIQGLKQIIEDAFDHHRQDVNTTSQGSIKDAVEAIFRLLDSGSIRVSEPGVDNQWVVNQWIKKAILLFFRLNEAAAIEGAPGGAFWWDKVPSKFQKMTPECFRKANFRATPGSIVRYGAHIGQQVVLMPSFVNVGAYIGDGSMIDTWATVGSCAQIGKHVHISGGAGIGGVLEPIQSSPVIIEDNCFIGARSEIVEGCIIREGAVLGMGVFIGMSTKIIHRETGHIFQGEVPPYSVVVPGSMPGRPLPDGSPGPCLGCAVIVKQVDAKTRAKTPLNDLLRS